MAAFVQRAAASQAVKDGCFDHLDVAYVQSLIRETDNDNSVKETNLHKPKAGENLVIRVDNKKGLVTKLKLATGSSPKISDRKLPITVSAKINCDKYYCATKVVPRSLQKIQRKFKPP